MAEATAKVAKSSNRGSKPGERRGGRKAGTPNKATAEIKALAQSYAEDALQTLADMMLDAQQPGKTRVTAATALLDRGYGKPAQALTGEDGAALFPAEVVWRRAGSPA